MISLLSWCAALCRGCASQVINSLADDQRLKTGNKAQHIPYRNSKLTHLLKDALGGNSQTLFLACVSPAESNESETATTLAVSATVSLCTGCTLSWTRFCTVFVCVPQYARQARNIQNKPVQNMDQTQLELRRLKLVCFCLSSATTHSITLYHIRCLCTSGGQDVDDEGVGADFPIYWRWF